MFNRKREISSTEKTEIVLEYLNEELTHLCGITTPTDQDHVSRSFRYSKTISVFSVEEISRLRLNMVFL